MPGPGRPLEVRGFPEPEPEPGAVVLRTLAAEVCGTDVHLWHGRLAGVPYPLIPGHVSVGEVLATGGDVRDTEDRLLRVGDAVTFLDVHGTCHACRFCTVLKATTRCPKRRVYGITYGAEEGLLGGWSERIYLKPGVKVLPLAPNVTPEQWIGGGCGLPTAVHAVELAQIRLADSVLIQGSGPVGLSACALALLSGAGWVGVIGAPARRLEAARRFGADWTMDVSQTTPGERARAVRDATGGYGPDIVVEASGNPDAVPEGAIWYATPAATSSSDSTPTTGTSSSTPTGTSTASTWRSAAAGARISATCGGPWSHGPLRRAGRLVVLVSHRYQARRGRAGACRCRGLTRCEGRRHTERMNRERPRHVMNSAMGSRLVARILWDFLRVGLRSQPFAFYFASARTAA